MLLDYYQPIRTDRSNLFANYTMRERLPEVVQNIINDNTDYSTPIREQLASLKQRIIGDAPIQPPDPYWWDYTEWHYSWNRHKGTTWLNAEWIFAETYLYRRIMQIIRYWEFGRDPFKDIKFEALTHKNITNVLTAGLSLKGPDEEVFAGLIGLSLWGNRMDLSYKTSMAHGTDLLDEEDLLINHTEEAFRTVKEGIGEVHIVTDNTGSELVADLMLADFLIRKLDLNTVFHVKFYPTYVSDAAPHDVLLSVEQMKKETDAVIGDFAGRLADHLEQQKLRLVPHPFWNSPQFLFNLPDNLVTLFKQSRLAIFKGDLNYRRMVKDAVLPPTLSFSEVADYFPTSALMLRCLKSDPIVGLPPGKAEQLDAVDSEWRTNGKRGIIQFYRST